MKPDLDLPRVLAVIGAQYGSEGKGAIVAHLAYEYDTHVRTGGPNAGHTFHWKGEPRVMQTVPCGWINPRAQLVIGAGGCFEPGILQRELDMIERAMPGARARVRIDDSSMVITDAQRAEEGGVEGDMHRRIGSTGKGVGTCRRDRLMRDPSKSFDAFSMAREFGFEDLLADTTRLVQDAVHDDTGILLEGAQGSGLSLIHGEWPYVTSADTNAAQLCADCGLPPHHLGGTLLVARTMPIRVAGNSGPMTQETNWEEISSRLGRATTERTTVTKKTRRVGAWDDALFTKAVRLNGSRWVALTFLDYLGDGSAASVGRWSDLPAFVRDWVRGVEHYHGVTAIILTTGPLPEHVIDRRHDDSWSDEW
jgi:adenylosuccinate synthase